MSHPRDGESDAVVGESNSLVLGGTGQFAVKVGIGTATPSNVLTIACGLGGPVSDSWDTYSSRRLEEQHPDASRGASEGGAVARGFV